VSWKKELVLLKNLWEGNFYPSERKAKLVFYLRDKR